MYLFLLGLFFSTALYSMDNEKKYDIESASESESGPLVTLSFNVVTIDGKVFPASGGALPMSRIDLSKSLLKAQDQLHSANKYYENTQDETIKTLIINACEEILERWDSRSYPQITKDVMSKYIFGLNRLKKEDIILEKPMYHCKISITNHNQFNSLTRFVHEIRGKVIDPACLTHITIHNVPLHNLLAHTTEAIFKTCVVVLNYYLVSIHT